MPPLLHWIRFRRQQTSQGQSVVEFALILPLMLFMFVAIIDLGRVYTTMVSVESAAREAADFGTFGSHRWGPDQAAVDNTVAGMRLRACVAASDLPGYVGPDDDCVNPSFSYCIQGDGACGAFDAAAGCDNALREPPCRVTVTMEYDFQLLVPLNMEVGGVRYGLPNTLTFQRSSTFAMTDLTLNP